MPQISFKLNGHEKEAHFEPGMHLLEVLREECGITSCKNGCAPEGACGCCMVNIDGRPVLSCLRKPEQMAGHEITTVEGLPAETRRIISEAFVLEGGVQCGFCIPGIVMRAAALIEQGKTHDTDAIRKALDGHICRCTGYGRIIDAMILPPEEHLLVTARNARITLEGICFLTRERGSVNEAFGRAWFWEAGMTNPRKISAN